jgi:hypothetical protein
MRNFLHGLMSKHMEKPVAKVAVEPVHGGAERSSDAVNPLQLRGLFVG